MIAASAPNLEADAGVAGMLTPFWIDEGVRVLAVGAGPDGLIRGLAQRGASVIVLEADASAARLAGRRSVGLTDVSVQHSTLSRMRPPKGTRHAAFDVLVHAQHRDRGGERRSPPVEDVVAAAADLLRASGTLILAVANPWGLRGMLEGTRDRSGLGPLVLQALLRTHGFGEQRWLIPYPDAERPEVIIDSRLYGSSDGVSIAEAFVRAPVRATPGATRLSDPLAAFHAAARAGLATSIADWFIVAAMRDGAADASIVHAGLLFVPPAPRREPAWADPRELERVGGRWLLHPAESYAPLASGPLALEPLTTAIPIGVSGEDLVVEALSHGLDHPVARETLGAWWAAAEAAATSGETGHRQLGIMPRDFVVTPDGTWAFIAGDLTLRFPMPAEVLGLRAITWTIALAVLPDHWIPGLPPTMTLVECARTLLEIVGVRCLDEHVLLWQELEVDLVLRTGRSDRTRDSARDEIAALSETRLGTHFASLPASAIVAAGLAAPALAADARSLRVQLAAARAELQATRPSSTASGMVGGDADG